MPGPIVHTTKPFNGEDPRKIWWETTAKRGRCPCGAPCSMMITTSMLVADLPPEVKAMLAIDIRTHKVKVQPYLTARGYAVRTGQAYACNMHSRDAELAAARGPSYAIVEIDRGPGEALRSLVVVAG